ncbi:MAG TPA: ATP-binding cassette domain-containing protein [Candidatus Hydrogenedentes bacterium]|jgi:oligopeptide/dipeptide ABC transporter ATP-binding protein|nr:ATP-binding cassette domain-containing protein [Candidatus Hydrogenedentota bacterium]HPK00015.1 ATP-binding cassette domain-containing protein [Candidatus Hydrogenedentota bacterium]
MRQPLLELRDLRVHFPVYSGLIRRKLAGTVRAVDGVSLDVAPGETVGLVGESGCGKSTLARAVVRLAPCTGGTVYFEGQEISALRESAFRALRPRLQLIFQDPYASLNPRMTVFDALAEPLHVHGLARGQELLRRVSNLMERVGLASRFMRKYPHEFSGGQRQRIAIARALALEPRLIIADEPVSALDVSVQAQILNLIARLREQMGLTLLFIAHDLSVVHYLSHRIAVMYLGRIVELGPASRVFHQPCHPYTRALISAIPVPDPGKEKTRQRVPLHDEPASPLNPPPGCPFHPRCPWAEPRCAEGVPPLESRGERHQAACFRRDLP